MSETIEANMDQSNILEVLFFSAVGGVFSLAAGLLLLANKNRALSFAQYATPFAAGALLAAAFTDLLPEAGHAGSIERALTWTLIGILIFFVLERFLRVFHHHHGPDEEHHADPTVPLIVIGDTLHNFIDGIAIAAGFLVDTQTGIVVTLAVAAHELPQELGDFGLLLHLGMKRRRVLLVNVLSALATTVAAAIFYTVGREVDLPLDVILGLTAGFFIYIAASDIMPTIHSNEGNNLAGPQTLLLILGVVLVSLTTNALHGYIDQGHEDHDEHSSLSEPHNH